MNHLDGIFQIALQESWSWWFSQGVSDGLKVTQAVLGQFPPSALSLWHKAIPLAPCQAWFEERPAWGLVLVNPLMFSQERLPELSPSRVTNPSLKGDFQGFPSDLHNGKLT